MIDSDYCRWMATYNAWMNRKFYMVCASLPEADLYADRGAFFQSIYLTLNHIAYADLAFLSRFTGDPADAPSLGTDLLGSFEALHTERQRLDDRLLHWVESISTDWLASSLTYTSKVDGQARTLPRWVLVSHLFQHQTHHRGQVTTLLNQLGHDVGSTDLPFMPTFPSEA
ncbi:DinB family protein [Cyanobium sp. Morenito 9A2]|uniref:DinB family protein n=1 Tax=Cyanobium sp. Morenito 9A2 TaxID=2823718 RepID=UPI0020CEBE7E|nr:DinB family protein [Cyanobium sp. Morenito 9A2]MCP9850374.1 damage-inducible protein DinB [Cyanobium sp. Morenito 9A2]